MTAQTSAIQNIAFGPPNERYLPPSLEPFVRNHVLAGVSVAQIAKLLNADEKRLIAFVDRRVAVWREQGPVPMPSEEGKTIVFRPHITKGGTVLMRPISLPFNTLHARALQASGARFRAGA